MSSGYIYAPRVSSSSIISGNSSDIHISHSYNYSIPKDIRIYSEEFPDSDIAEETIKIEKRKDGSIRPSMKLFKSNG